MHQHLDHWRPPGERSLATTMLAVAAKAVMISKDSPEKPAAIRAAIGALWDASLYMTVRAFGRVTRSDRRWDKDDFRQDLMLAMFRAVEGFDPAMRLAWLTYWANTVVMEVGKSRKRLRLIHVPKYLEFPSAHGRYRRRDDCLQAAAQALRPMGRGTAYQSVPSREPPVGEDEETEAAESDGGRGELETLVDALPPRMKFVILARFGLRGQKRRTLRSIGEEIGMTKERVRQIEVAGVKVLSGSATPSAFAFAAPVRSAGRRVRVEHMLVRKTMETKR